MELNHKFVEEHLWMWHQNLTRLTNDFVQQTQVFFNHCKKVEKDFALTTNHLLRVWEELHSKLNVEKCNNNINHNLRMNNNNLVNVATIEEREAHIQLLVDKFTTLALEFERILRDSERKPPIINYEDQKFVPPPPFLLSSSASSMTTTSSSNNSKFNEENEKEDNDDEKSMTNSTQSSTSTSTNGNCHLDELTDFLERTIEDLSNFCEYRKETLSSLRDDENDKILSNYYLHFEQTPILQPLNELLRVVESEFVRLWKNEDRLRLGQTMRVMTRCSSVGTQTDDEEKADDNKYGKNVEREIQLWLFQEKLFLSHQRDELGKVERQLRSREENVRRQEKQFILDRESWDKEKKNLTPSNSTFCPSARTSCSEGNLIPFHYHDSKIIPPILSPPPDLRASSFDRFKRFPHVHPLSERFNEISNNAKSFSPSGFNRYHFYLSKMTDVLEFYQRKNLQLSERIESNKFVSVITVGTNHQNDHSNVDNNVTDNVIAIGHGNTALEATEKAVQMSHDFIQNSALESSSCPLSKMIRTNFEKSSKNLGQNNQPLLFDVLGAGDM